MNLYGQLPSRTVTLSMNLYGQLPSGQLPSGQLPSGHSDRTVTLKTVNVIH